MSDAMLVVIEARKGVELAVLRVLSLQASGDYGTVITAWGDVDEAAAKLVKARRAYRKYLKEVLGKF